VVEAVEAERGGGGEIRGGGGEMRGGARGGVEEAR